MFLFVVKSNPSVDPFFNTLINQEENPPGVVMTSLMWFFNPLWEISLPVHSGEEFELRK